jgi:hypothetical protein
MRVEWNTPEQVPNKRTMYGLKLTPWGVSAPLLPTMRRAWCAWRLAPSGCGAAGRW